VIVLREDTTDPVADAAFALAEAAHASDSSYTLDELRDMVADGAGALAEAGGLFSWLSRAYTGTDSTLVPALKKQIEGITTEAQKVKALAEIDKYRKEVGESGPSKINWAQMTWPGLLIRFLRGQSAKVEEYREGLSKLRAEVAAKSVGGGEEEAAA
jgi:hypothetical protein